MSIVADQMKDHINNVSNIKIKLMKQDIWSADKVSNSLKSHKNIDHIDISDRKDKLYIHMKPEYKPIINSIDLNFYSEITKATKKIINPKNNHVKSLLNETELNCINDLGIDKITNMMYHIYNIPNGNLVVMDL